MAPLVTHLSLCAALLLAAASPRAARGAVVARFSDAACTAPTGTTKIFGTKCYGHSMQHGRSESDWLLFLGQAPIVRSWALQSCAPGTLTVAYFDTPAGVSDFCQGSPTSTATLPLNTCVPDPAGAGDTGGGFAKLVDDTCLASNTENPFFVANMFYSPTCELSRYVFRSTYMSSFAGACEIVQIPEFLGSRTFRATSNYSTLFGGGYQISWFSTSDASCPRSTLQQTFTSLKVGACSEIYGGAGGVILYVPPDFDTAVTLPSPSPTPTNSPPPAAGGGKLSNGAAGAAADKWGAALLAAAAAAAAALCL
jgi:hypothetical protein